MATNSTYISSSEIAKEHGYDDVTIFLTSLMSEGIIPACCSEGCEVEMDGHCEHGNPSVFLDQRII